ncbi:hypothetical protein BDZ45DRAFT_745163 [Acephala macrosclerotiorum]|nr:hypothetical protein BDZ45DRAFT_745163 [Acephala macrosclerotiorum]
MTHDDTAVHGDGAGVVPVEELSRPKSGSIRSFTIRSVLVGLGIGAVMSFKCLFRIADWIQQFDGNALFVTQLHILQSVGKPIIFSVLGLFENISRQENLPFPSATATAVIIKFLRAQDEESLAARGSIPEEQPLLLSDAQSRHNDDDPNTHGQVKHGWKVMSGRILLASRGSGTFTLLAYFLPVLRNLPVFGIPAARDWLWTLNLSPGFFAQGVIIGPIVPLHMLAGALIGWGILSPIAKNCGWAPGPVAHWDTGSRGWIMWVSLAAMLADCITKFLWLILSTTKGHFRNIDGLRFWVRKSNSIVAQSFDSSRSDARDEAETLDNSSLSGNRTPATQNTVFQTIKSYDSSLLLSLSVLFCAVSVKIAFHEFMPFMAAGIAVILSFGIGKLTQLIFALIIPKSNPNGVLINLLEGGIAEEGAIQAGELIYSLKAASIIGAWPQAQLYGSLIGGTAGVFMTIGFYRLYTSVYTIPGDLDATLCWEFSVVTFVAFVVIAVIKIRYAQTWWANIIPGGVAFAMGMYNIPAFTLTRAIGGVARWYFTTHFRINESQPLILASGMILGEGVMSIFTLALAAFRVPHF